MIERGTIELRLDGVSLQETERYREMITIMFQQGVFNMRSGNCTLHFSDDGMLQLIDMNYRKWRRERK